MVIILIAKNKVVVYMVSVQNSLDKWYKFDIFHQFIDLRNWKIKDSFGKCRICSAFDWDDIFKIWLDFHNEHRLGTGSLGEFKSCTLHESDETERLIFVRKFQVPQPSQSSINRVHLKGSHNQRGWKIYPSFPPFEALKSSWVCTMSGMGGAHGHPFYMPSSVIMLN